MKMIRFVRGLNQRTIRIISLSNENNSADEKIKDKFSEEDTET